MNEYQKQELLPDEERSEIMKKIMMLKSWFAENMDKELTRFEYNYVSEALIKQCGADYSNRDLFGIQVWVLKAPVYSGKLHREKCDFDLNIVEFMNSVGLNWDYWGTCMKSDVKGKIDD